MAIFQNNLQDIWLRNSTIAVLDLFNNKVNIDQVEDCEYWDIKRYEIPFFMNNGTGDENFLKDFFINVPENCKVPKYAEGNYEPIPRGIITFTGMVIRSSDIVNKYVRGTFQKEVKDSNGERISKAYSSRLFVIPFTLTYDVEITTTSLNQSFKAVQALIDLFYKNNILYYGYKGNRIQANLQFPEGYSIEKLLKFTYLDDNKISIKFSCEVETYFPSFDNTTERFRGNIMKEITGDIIEQNASKIGEIDVRPKDE